MKFKSINADVRFARDLNAFLILKVSFEKKEVELPVYFQKKPSYNEILECTSFVNNFLNTALKRKDFKDLAIFDNYINDLFLTLEKNINFNFSMAISQVFLIALSDYDFNLEFAYKYIDDTFQMKRSNMGIIFQVGENIRLLDYRKIKKKNFFNLEELEFKKVLNKESEFFDENTVASYIELKDTPLILKMSKDLKGSLKGKNVEFVELNFNSFFTITELYANILLINSLGKKIILNIQNEVNGFLIFLFAELGIDYLKFESKEFIYPYLNFYWDKNED